MFLNLEKINKNKIAAWAVHGFTGSGAVLGFLAIPMTYVETSHQSFDAVAFEILNDTGILRAGTEEIHRGLLHRWNNDINHQNDRNNPRVKTAHTVDTIFKNCQIAFNTHHVKLMFF